MMLSCCGRQTRADPGIRLALRSHVHSHRGAAYLTMRIDHHFIEHVLDTRPARRVGQSARSHGIGERSTNVDTQRKISMTMRWGPAHRTTCHAPHRLTRGPVQVASVGIVSLLDCRCPFDVYELLVELQFPSAVLIEHP